jgi:hypothetical protein
MLEQPLMNDSRALIHIDALRYIPQLMATLTNIEDPRRVNTAQQEDIIAAIQASTAMCDRGQIPKEFVRRVGLHSLMRDVLHACFQPYGDPGGMFVLDSNSVKKRASQNEQSGKLLTWIKTALLPTMFAFFASFAKDCAENQRALEPDCMHLLAGLDHGLFASRTLACIYRGNEQLCQDMDLRIIERIVQVIASKTNKEGTAREARRPYYLDALEVFCLIDGRAMTGCQHHLIACLCEHGPLLLKDGEQERALLLFRQPQGKRMRAQLIRDGEESNQEGLLQYNVKLLKLLSSLLVDNNPQIYSLVRQMLTPNELFEDITSASCITPAKSQLILLFQRLYIADGSFRHMPAVTEYLHGLLEYLLGQLSSVSFHHVAHLIAAARQNNSTMHMHNNTSAYPNDERNKGDPNQTANMLSINLSLSPAGDKANTTVLGENECNGNGSVLADLVSIPARITNVSARVSESPNDVSEEEGSDRRKHGNTQEGAAQMTTAQAEAELSQLICTRWAPLLVSVLSERALVATAGRRHTISSLVGILMEILNAVEHSSRDTSALVHVWHAAQRANLAKGKGPNLRAIDMSRLDLSAINYQPYKGADDVEEAYDVDVRRNTIVRSKLDLFARALIEALDPVSADGALADESQEALVTVREELTTLCKVLHNSDRALHGKGVSSTAAKEEFRADEAQYLVLLLSSMKVSACLFMNAHAHAYECT